MAQRPRIEEDLDSRFSDLRSSVKSVVKICPVAHQLETRLMPSCAYLKLSSKAVFKPVMFK